MKRQYLSPLPMHRVRQSSREIALAVAVTLAAVLVFLMAREPTEIASMPLTGPATIETP